MNSIDTSWLDGMIREKTVKIKYEMLGLVVKTWVSVDVSDWSFGDEWYIYDM